MKIKSIQKVGREEVYDIVGVEDNNNYIANSFIVHNSSEDWNKRESKFLKKKLAQVRTKHLLFILCFPLKIYKLDKSYLYSYVNYWCSCAGTKILIKDHTGMIRNYPIEKLYKNKKYKVASYNVETKKIEFVKPKGRVKTHNRAEVYQVELENGIKIKVTKDHPFLTKDGYKRLEELKENDEVIVRGKICPTCKKEFVPSIESMIYCCKECGTNSEYRRKTAFQRMINMMHIKIKKITKLKRKVPVYDIVGVPKNHNYIANNIVVHNCDLYARGMGAIYVKDRNPVLDSWRMKDFMKVGSYTEFTSSSKIEAILKKHPNFWSIIKFPKPPTWLYNRYLLVREKNVYDDDNVFANVTKEDIYYACMLLSLKDIMQHDTTLSMNRVILHIKNEYDITLKKVELQHLIDDAVQLINRVREQGSTVEDFKAVGEIGTLQDESAQNVVVDAVEEDVTV